MHFVIIGLGILIALCLICSLVYWIIVVVRLFKEKGAIHGILGIVISLYPYIWGWIKHKELKLTKTMLIWTISYVLAMVLSIGMAIFVPVMFADKMTKNLPGVMQQSVKRQGIVTTKRPPRKSTPRSARQKAAVMTVDKKPVPKAMTSEQEIKMLDELIKGDGNNAAALYNRAWLYASKNDFEKAVKDYTKAIQIDKGQADVYFNRGLLYVKMKKYDLAVKDFDEAIKLKPRDADAYCNRGGVNNQLGNMDFSIKDYTEALKIRPNDADTLYSRGVVYQFMGNKTKAIEDFKKAAKMGHKKAREGLRQASKS
ncbi:MAG: tetratricopeptide repeat protein [Desulfobacterales bacterium]|nr:tetratricopeptide repeat protein [Desulfobacterales bacterium]